MICDRCGSAMTTPDRNVYDYNDYVLLFKTKKCTSCGHEVRFK